MPVDIGLISVVDTDTDSVLDLCQVKVVLVEGRRRWIRDRMPDVVYTASSIEVIRRLNIVSAHVRSFRAEGGNAGVGGGCIRNLTAIISSWNVASIDRCSCCFAKSDLIEATVQHEVRELSIAVNCVVVGFDAICIVHSELGIPLGLYSFVNDAVADTFSTNGYK